MTETQGNTVYLAGKMRGIPKYNFPAFRHYSAKLRAQGWDVVSPAEMDEDKGFTEDSPEPDGGFLRDAILRDVTVIIQRCDALALIPGWETSMGIKVEIALARFLGLKVFCADTGKEFTFV